MKRSSIIILFFLFCICIQKINAQAPQLTLEQAVQIALKNNYDILLTKNIAEQAVNSNTLGNAGMIPTVNLNASGVTSKSNIKQEFPTAPIIEKTGVGSNNITTGAYLTWTVFDGFKMFATNKRLQELESLGMLSEKIQIESTLVQVISAYYAVVMHKQLINALKENMEVSEERLKIASKKFEIGASSKVDVLQAKVDLNAQKSSLMKEKNLLSDSKANLNQLLALYAENDFDVPDTIPVMNNYKYEDLKNSTTQKNSDFLFAQKNVSISKLMIKETKALYYPKLNLNANYIFTRAENQAGFTLLNQNLGLNLGFTLSWTFFNGFNTNNNVKSMKLNLEYSILQFSNIKSQNQLLLTKTFKKYQDDLAILNLEDENNKLAKENLDIALELFRLGKSTSIDLKTAQQSFEDSINRLSSARYETKISETELLKLSGDIIK